MSKYCSGSNIPVESAKRSGLLPSHWYCPICERSFYCLKTWRIPRHKAKPKRERPLTFKEYP